MALDEKLQIPHVSCSLSLRHLDRFLLILITIISLYPPLVCHLQELILLHAV